VSLHNGPSNKYSHAVMDKYAFNCVFKYKSRPSRTEAPPHALGTASLTVGLSFVSSQTISSTMWLQLPSTNSTEREKEGEGGVCEWKERRGGPRHTVTICVSVSLNQSLRSA